MTELKTSLRGLAEIAGHEGIVPYPYRDSAGVWTFGIGHTVAAGSPDPSALPRGESKPLRVVLEIFREDIKRYEARVRRAVKVPLTQAQFDALVSFDFNTGGIDRAKLTRAINAGEFAGAAKAFDGWHRPPEIIPRRNAEKALFRDGVYSHNGMATAYPADAAGRVQWAKGERINVLSILRSDRFTARQPDDPGVPDVDNGEVGDRPSVPGRGSRLLWSLAGGALLFLAGRFWGATKWIAGALWSGLKAIARTAARLLGAGQ